MMELYYAPDRVADGRVRIAGLEARHISRVMRHRAGDQVQVTDGRGAEHLVELEKVTADEVVGRVLQTCLNEREPRHPVTLALAVLKGDRLAQACEQASEVGVARFIPLVTERTIGRLSSTRLARLRGVALAATKSSTRTVLPVVEPAIALSRLVERVPEYDRSLVAYEDEHRTGLGDVLDRTAATVLLVVGPEGGFTPGEIQLLATASVRPFSLGPRRLRAETAAVAAVSGVLQLLGDLG